MVPKALKDFHESDLMIAAARAFKRVALLKAPSHLVRAFAPKQAWSVALVFDKRA